ncbi:MAG: hypothetical protein V4487_03080, partial [Chlamydiota bacterium]
MAASPSVPNHVNPAASAPPQQVMNREEERPETAQALSTARKIALVVLAVILTVGILITCLLLPPLDALLVCVLVGVVALAVSVPILSYRQVVVVENGYTFRRYHWTPLFVRASRPS